MRPRAPSAAVLVPIPVPPLRLVAWLLGALGVAAGASTLAGRPLPLVLCSAGLGLQVTVATLGVLLPSLRVFADVYGRGPRQRPELALTFDDGPDPETTPRVLELLRRHNAQATFFVIGEKARTYPELVRRIRDEGHVLGVHGHVHDRLYALRGSRFVAEDLARACETLAGITGVHPELFRPPIGFVSPAVAACAERAGLLLVGFTLRALDGRRAARPARVLARVTAALEPGAVIVLHDAAERGGYVPASLDVLETILARARERGLRLVSVDALRRAL